MSTELDMIVWNSYYKEILKICYLDPFIFKLSNSLNILIRKMSMSEIFGIELGKLCVKFGFGKGDV